MINKVTLIGNLGRDPEVKTFESGGNVAKLAIATNENYKDKNGEWQTSTEWHDVVIWNQEQKVSKLQKGNLVYIEGKLATRSYEDQSGNTRRVTEVKANYFRSLEKKEATADTNWP